MSLGISSDLIMDVAKAADPGRSRAAIARLADSQDPSAFAALVDRTPVRADRKAPITPAEGAIINRSSFQDRSANSAKSVGAAFEAMMLQSLLQNLMPQQTTSVFGKGMAGSAYRMFMAEQFAKQMTNVGVLGIGTIVDRSIAARGGADRTMPTVLGKSFDV